jgi:hypothetical protein
MDLPNDLRSALAKELATIPQKSMADAAANLPQNGHSCVRTTM